MTRFAVPLRGDNTFRLFLHWAPLVPIFFYLFSQRAFFRFFSLDSASFIHSFIPLACAECDDSLSFSWAFLHSSLLCTVSCHPSPPTIVPSSLTSSCSFIHSFIPLACAECDHSLPFSGASSIPFCYVHFPATLLHPLFFHPPSLLLAHSFIPLACVECNDSLLFSGASSIPLCYVHFLWGTAVAKWLRCCATNRKVAGSIPAGGIGIFHWHNPSDRTMALWSTQPLTEMSTSSISWG